MCGIVGRVNFNNIDIEEESLTKMMKKIKHRGPDDDGVFIDGGVGLGFVRLSILDLSLAGHQPMVSDDNRFVLVYNGEVYNYIELREELKEKGYKFRSDSDSEVVLKSYQEWGKACLDKFNGMWAFVVIYDRETKEIFGARDRFGIKPFYYYRDDNSFIFASEIKAIRVALDKLTINDQAVFNYISFNRTDYGDRTFYSEIYKVPHGHSFTLSPQGEFKLNRWYDLESHCNRKDKITPQEYAELLTSSVKLRMRSDVPVGVCLSGGLDSSAIASIISKKLNIEDIHSFSAVYDKGQNGDESEFIEELSPYLNNMRYIKPNAEALFDNLHDFVSNLDEPVPTTSIFAQYSVMKLANRDAVVTLDGQGADEQLAGYHYFYGFYFKELLTQLSLIKLFSEIFDYMRLHKSIYGLKTLAFFLLPKKLKINLNLKKSSYIQNDFYLNHNSNNALVDGLYSSDSLKKSLINHFEYKLEHLLKWSDLNSMRFSIESRVPFLDYRLVEQTLSLQNDNYIKKGVTKYILRESMKFILPEKIRLRYDKMGFETPEDEWFRESFFVNMINEILDNPTDKFQKYINTKVAKEMYSKHLNREINCSKDIWKWINLDLWLKAQ